MAHKFNRFLIVAACAAVTSLFTVSAAPCAAGSFDTIYEAPSFSCTFGGLTFSNFLYGAGPGSPTDLTVTPVTTPAGVGFDFSANFSAAPGQNIDGNVYFSVSDGGGPATITDAALAQVSGVSGNGSATVAEQGCTPSPAPSSPGCVPDTAQNNSNTFALFTFDFGSSDRQTFDQAFFAPSGFINVVKDIGVNGGSITPGGAHLSLVEDVFSVVPEPRGVAMLLGLCLIAGLAFRKRLQNARG